MALRSTSLVETIRSEPAADASLFERFPWIYAFFRERVFRDDTDRIISSLWPAGGPSHGSTLIELGCGPGFYARQLAERFPQLNVIGIDRSDPLLELASQRARLAGLANCHFEWGDAQMLAYAGQSSDAVVASRLFTILADPARAISEIHRVLRSGGACFIAEPRPHPLARVPLHVMWLTAGVLALASRNPAHYREPDIPMLLETSEFARLIHAQSWGDVRIWTDRRYQYAVCIKE